MEIEPPQHRQEHSSGSTILDVFGEVIPNVHQLLSELNTYKLAKAFSRPELTPLHVYRAASHISEGVLREVVQILTYEPSTVAATTARLLSIMRGLPGNLELALLFLQQHIQDFHNFDLRTTTFFSFICGPLLLDMCDWGPIIRKAVDDNCPESKLALSCLYEIKLHEPMEPITHLYKWESEAEHANAPSFWRELRWASFTRSLVSAGIPSTLEAMHSFGNDVVAALPVSYGSATPHYVRVGKQLLPRRSFATKSLELELMEVKPKAAEDGKSSRDGVVITQSIRHVIEDISNYLAYGVSFILEGPTGCGKTTILSYLGREVSYNESKPSNCFKVPGVTFIQMDNAMTSSDGDSFTSLVGEIVPVPNGGGFTWRPGPIGLAAQRGDWLVFENIGRGDQNNSSALPVLLQLANAKPGDSLDSPGRGESIRIAKGFRCIATRSISENNAGDSWEPPGGWNTWKRVRMQGLSTTEKVELLRMRFTSIQDCVERVVAAVEETSRCTESSRVSLMKRPTMREAIRICRRLELTRNMWKALSIEHAVRDSYDVLGASCNVGFEQDLVLKVLANSWSVSPGIVRDLCLKHRPSVSKDQNILSIGRASCQPKGNESHPFRPTLAINGHTSRLLEVVLRSLQMEEHVLLVGEAGSGKTSVVQELASLLNQELTVVNLSRQSDIGDLIGGFKPLELENAIPALGKRFELFFCRVMSKEKNSRFLDALQRACSSNQKYNRAIRLMAGALKAFPKEQKARNPQLSEEWDSIAKDLEKLQVSVTPSETVCGARATKTSGKGDHGKRGEPPRKRPRSLSSCGINGEHRVATRTSSSRNEKKKLGFAFSEGVLVKAMREGKWILLDEINLAPPELLERLVSIIDRGEVLLGNESGEVVSQTHGFSLFGAMNPPTDVGKRYLPEVLRSRFSEIYVGDMIDREDVVDLVMSRLFRAHGSVDFSKDEGHLANDITSFYIESSSLARDGRIEDNAGRPAKYSIRTLARMLDFAKGVGSLVAGGLHVIRRILYEGALLAFCTALPATSRAKVLHLARHFILKHDIKGKPPPLPEIANMIPLNLRERVRLQVVEGFPVERSSSPCDTALESPFVVSASVSATLKDVCRALIIGAPQLPILLQGPTAAGKTSMVAYLASLTGNRLIRINNHEHTDLSEYVGSYVATSSGLLAFSEGPLVKAAREGHWIMLDELNLAPPDVLESLNRLLDDNREIFIPETGETVKAAAGFRLFATQNPPGLYGGRKELSRAFRSRFVEVMVEELPDEDLLFILEKRSGIPQSFTRKMVTVMRDLQVKRKVSGLFSGREGFVTARDLFRWASRHPRSKEELAVHGFFLLGERCRISSERNVVRKVLIKHTGVSADFLSDESLYSLLECSEMKGIADDTMHRSLQLLCLTRESLKAALKRAGIALTPTTVRMLTLVIHCVANNEPVLLVGTTGGGKTTICSALSEAMSQKLLAVNCHRHTESSDILGGFRPVRHRGPDDGIFEWSDGPLVRAMKEGCTFLIDEINMAEDAVIERLNSVLEPQRSVLLSERGAIPNVDNNKQVEAELVQGHPNFRIMATMNPGGDYGKRELSPALRNRFTEIWIPKPCKMEDFVPIIDSCLKDLLRETSSSNAEDVTKIMLQFLEQCLRVYDSTSPLERETKSKMEFHISLRDLRAWCDFVESAVNNFEMDPVEALMHGARVVFLDGLSVGGTRTNSEKEESRIWFYLLSLASPETIENLRKCRYDSTSEISFESGALSDKFIVKVDRFTLHRNAETKTKHHADRSTRFCFRAPGTKRNIARLTRALAITSRPILLEGPPGSGKSSLISALADLSGNQFTRINLSESTEMSDLIGTDAPDSVEGSFKFQTGPLLTAMKQGAWLLLDELNLASQSVLEGLNSVLDHRRTVFIPETNQSVSAHEFFRVFGAQNPVHGGGGRRGLPQSFLNRFTRVVVDAPSDEDILCIIESVHDKIPKYVSENVVKVLALMREEDQITSASLTDFGLRDALRWCDVLSGALSFRSQDLESERNLFDSKEYIRMSFDVSVLQGLTDGKIHEMAEAIFKKVFGFEWQGETRAPSLRAAGNSVRVGFGHLKQMGNTYFIRNLEPQSGTLDCSLLRPLQAMAIAVHAGWPVVLLSGTDVSADEDGKRLVQFLGMSCGKKVRTIYGASLLDAEMLIGGYSQRGGAQYMLQIIALAQELLRVMIKLSVGLDRGLDEMDMCSSVIVQAQAAYRSMRALCYRITDHINVPWNFQNPQEHSEVHEFASEADAFMRSSRLMLKESDFASATLNNMASYNAEVWKMASRRKFGNPLAFEWKKSDLVRAIEHGEWILIQGAEMCPPAVLDRLNPLFERPAISPEDLGQKTDSKHTPRVLLAEAPSAESGSPLYLSPHPDFRIFFNVSKRFSFADAQGLSRPLLDRCLRICLQPSSDELRRSNNQGMNYSSSISRSRNPNQRLSPSMYLERQRSQDGTKGTAVSGEEFMINDVSALCARAADFVLHPELFCLDIDLWNLIQVIGEPERKFEAFATALITSFKAFMNGMEFTHEHHDRKRAEHSHLYRRELQASLSRAILLASSSAKDMVSRSFYVKRNSKPQLDSTTAGSGTAGTFISKNILSDVDMGDFSCPIDPLYAMDRTPIELMLPKHKLQLGENLGNRAIFFRAEILAFHPFQEAWKEAESSANPRSILAKARLKGQIHGSGKADVDTMCFEILTSAARNLELTRKALVNVDGLQHPYEAEVYQIYDILCLLCQIMMQETPSNTSLWAQLDALSHIGNKLVRVTDMDLLGLSALKRLIPQIQKLGEAIHWLTFSPKLSLMPRSKQSQLVEEQLLDALQYPISTTLLPSGVDAGVRAIASLSSHLAEENVEFLRKLASVADSLNQKPAPDNISDWNRTLQQFRSVVRIMAVRSMEDCLSSVTIVSGASAHTHLLRACAEIDSLWSTMRCLPFFCLESLVAVMRLSWLLDSIGADMKNSNTKAYVDKNEQDLFLFAYLRECNKSSEPESSGALSEVKVDSNPVNAIVEFLRAPQDYLFWDLETSYHQAAATSGVFAVNSRICSLRSTSIKVLFFALVSALRLDQARTEACDFIQDLEYGSFEVKLAALVSFFERHDCDTSGNASLERNLSDRDLALASVGQAHKKTSAPKRRNEEAFRYIGTAWIAIGIYRLQSYLTMFDDVKDYDPSYLIEKKIFWSMRTKIRLGARRKAYELIQRNRLGGDEFPSSIPARVISNELQSEDEKLASCRSCYVHRDPNKNSFESFVRIVQAVKSNVFDKIKENRFLFRAKQFADVQLLRLIPELKHFISVCKATSESLSFHGSHSHFRDLSLRLRLGIEEIHHGLQWMLRATDIIGIGTNRVLYRKLRAVSNLCLFPRAVFRNAGGLLDTFSLCAELAPSGKMLIKAVRFLLENGYLEESKAFSCTSELCSRIVKIWKASVERSETETRIRESLHIIRQSSQENELNAASFLEVSEQQEHEDFISTFNPVGNDLEDELLGLRSTENSVPLDHRMVEDTGDETRENVLEIDSSDFWALHQLIFPCSQYPNVLNLIPQVQPCKDTLLSFAAELSFLGQEGVKPVLGTGIVSGVWGFLCSCSVTQSLSGVPDITENENLHTGQNPDYNFYTDPNAREIQQASNALFKLKVCIENIQRLRFEQNGNHPVLDGIMVAIDCVARVSRSSTPLSIVIIGLENVLRKADEWNRLFATGPTKLQAELIEVLKLVSRWRAVEMRSWPFLLAARKRKFETQANKWVFLIYDSVINESLSSNSNRDEHLNSVLSTLDRFLRSSPSGEFCRRLAIVQSISHHLLSFNDARRDLAQLIGRGLRGMCRFYHIFQDHLAKKLSQQYETVLQELRDFTSIVSYNPQEELGSAVKMSKGRDKNLDYFRLKAFSDKTRRRVHKLCLKVDGILRVPFYEHVTEFTESLGFNYSTILNFASTPDPIRPQRQDYQTKISAKIACGEKGIRDTKEISAILLPTGLKMLSRFDTLQRRLDAHGREIQNSSWTECEAASEFCSKLRIVIRSRVGKLQEEKVGNDIQPKRRALVDLLQGLSKAGLSPFERPSANAMLRWLSATDPSSSEIFNKNANQLYFSVIHQYQTLRNVSDSSARNNDINAEEASRIRAFCRDLLDKSAMERKELNFCSTVVQNLSEMVDILTKPHQDILGTNCDNPSMFCCFQEMLLRLRRAKSTLQNISSLMKDAKRDVSGLVGVVHGKRNALDDVLSFYRKVGKNSLTQLHIILDTCCNKIEDEPEAISRIDVSRDEHQVLSYFNGRCTEWCETVRVYLSSLRETLHVGLSRAREVSQHNVVTELLSPVLSLVEEYEDGIAESPLPSSPEKVAHALRNSLFDNAEELVHNMLISAQQAMTWNGIGDQAKKGTSGEAPPSRKDGSELFPDGIIRKGHYQAVNLGSLLLLTRITSQFDANTRYLRRLIPFRGFFNGNEIKELIGVQNALGFVLKEYLRSMLIPCFEKAVTQHYESLALLRTLTNLFIGICKDGFCRPVQQEQTEDMMDTDVKSGTGFGDAGDGDLSGAQDVSEAIEDEEQLLGLKDEKDRGALNENEQARNEDGFDMKTDFEGILEDVDGAEEQDVEGAGESEKQMGEEHGQGENVLNEKLWDSEEEANNEQELEFDSHQEDKGNEFQGNGIPDEWAAGNRNDKNHHEEQSKEESVDDDSKNLEDEGKQTPEENAENFQELENKGTDALKEGEHNSHEETGEPENLGMHHDDLQQSGTEKPNEDGEGDHHMTDDSNPDFAKSQEPDLPLKQNDQEVEEADSDGGSPMVGTCNDHEVSDNEMMDENQAEGLPENCHLPGEEEEPQGDWDNEKINPEDEFENNNQLFSPDTTKTDEEEIQSTPCVQDDKNSNDGERCQETGKDTDVLDRADADAKPPDSEEKYPEMNMVPGQSTTGQDDKDIEDNTAPFAHQGHGKLSFGSNMNDVDREGNDIANRNRHDYQSGSGNEVNAQNGGEDEAKVNSSTNEKEKLEKGSTSMSINPLRLSDPEDLIEEWNECLRGLRDDVEQLPQQNDGGNSADEWRYGTTEDSRSNPQHALGAASQEQHRPLPDERIPELDNANTQNQEKESKPELGEAMYRQDKREVHFRQDQDSLSQDSNEDIGDPVQEDIVKPHPARFAINREQEPNINALDYIDRPETSTIGTHEKVDCDNSGENEEPTSAALQDLGWRVENLDHAQAKELWHALESKVASNAASLCEQMRLVLEPTKASRMGGGYRTGKRLNMRKVIEYVASDFRKDRIWLRRVKPDKRSYDVLIAIDDSASMLESEAGAMATESLALVISALSKLEVGRIAVASFGSDANLIRRFEEPLPINTESGARLLQSFTFSQTETKIVNLLHFIHSQMGLASNDRSIEHISLALVISDGRLSDREEVRRQLRILRESNVLVAFFILDRGTTEENSIYNVQRVEYEANGKMSVKPYMQDFPIDFYAVVQNMNSLPGILADALRQWIEITNYQ